MCGAMVGLLATSNAPDAVRLTPCVQELFEAEELCVKMLSADLDFNHAVSIALNTDVSTPDV